MLIAILKSKIHMATVTETNLYYEGSIGIDPKLLSAAGIIPGEKVQVLNFNSTERFETYAIEGKSGEFSLKGPAAKLGKKGDKVIILAYGHLTPEEAKNFKPKIVKVNAQNEAI